MFSWSTHLAEHRRRHSEEKPFTIEFNKHLLSTYYVPGGLLGTGDVGVSSVDAMDALDVAELLCAVQPTAGRTSPLGSKPGN